MDDSHEKLKRFIAALKDAELHTSRPDDAEVLRGAQRQADRVFHDGRIDEQEYSDFARFLADCVPWEGDILSRWEDFEKAVKRTAGRRAKKPSVASQKSAKATVGEPSGAKPKRSKGSTRKR